MTSNMLDWEVDLVEFLVGEQGGGKENKEGARTWASSSWGSTERALEPFQGLEPHLASEKNGGFRSHFRFRKKGK